MKAEETYKKDRDEQQYLVKSTNVVINMKDYNTPYLTLNARYP